MTGTERPGADAATRPSGQMTETEFCSLYERLRGQLPWGPDDLPSSHIAPGPGTAALSMTE
jgi:hypothetical protein